MLVLSRVVHQDVQCAETLHVRRDARFDVVLGANIDLCELRLVAGLAAARQRLTVRLFH